MMHTQLRLAANPAPHRRRPTVAACRGSVQVACSQQTAPTRREVLLAVPGVAALVSARHAPAFAFGEPVNDAQYLTDTAALLQTLQEASTSRSANVAAAAEQSDAWLDIYKRNHKGHHKSYTAVYMAASVVKAQGDDPMPVEKMQKLGRLVQHAANDLTVEMS